MLHKAEMDNQIRGVRICRRAPSISHILFADDILLFFQVSVEANKHVQELLKWYSKSFGQVINNDKTSLTFSSNIPSTIEWRLVGFGVVRDLNNIVSTLASPLLLVNQGKKHLKR